MHSHMTSDASTEDRTPTHTQVDTSRADVTGRRSFLKGAGIAGGAVLGSAVFAGAAGAQVSRRSNRITPGDVAILRFLAAAELIEADLWQQYDELGGVNGGNAFYMAALSNIDPDMPTYIHLNNEDEQSHAMFLNAYLKSKGADPVNLDAFRKLPSSKATGAKTTGRLTSLTSLNVDTSWYTRYRSTTNPDFGATFPQAIEIHNQPAIPVSDQDTPPNNTTVPTPATTPQESRIQAIACTAAFHFGFIEQGGSSLYATLAEKVSNVEVLRIVASIGGTEDQHFATWQDDAGNAAADPIAPVTDPETHLTIPDLNNPGGPLLQTNLIFPHPCEFISPNLPLCAIVRPTLDRDAGAQAAVKAFTDDGLFQGQSAAFFSTLRRLAVAADDAVRR
jgi:hypothetical protein